VCVNKPYAELTCVRIFGKTVKNFCATDTVMALISVPQSVPQYTQLSHTNSRCGIICV